MFAPLNSRTSTQDRMSTVVLPSGVSLYYSDFGKPSVDEYDTFVLVHGVAYNLGGLRANDTNGVEVFAPLKEVVPSDVRVFAYNQRGFRGSTPLSNEERELTADRSELARNYTFDLIEFVDYIAKEYHLPRKPILIGWSKGTNLLLALASPTFLAPEWRQRALAVTSALVLYEAPGTAFGLSPGLDYFASMEKEYPPGISTEERARVESVRFGNWVSGFYSHQEVDSPEPKFAVESYAHSADTLDSELFVRSFQPELVPIGFYWNVATDPVERRGIVVEALQQKEIPVAMAWNGQTVSYCIAAIKEAEKVGARTYKLDEGGNHLFFAHEPRKWLDGMRRIARDLTQK
jgi:pimeloyl-ACP methyl ester carboxylesterase